LVGYILCIIDCHICQDIFGRIDIMYCRLPYVSRGDLPLKTRVLFIYTSQESQCNTTNNYTQSILLTWPQIMFRSSKSSTAFVRAAPGRSISTPPRATLLVRQPILLIQPPLHRVKPSVDRSSPSDHHRHWPPTQLHSHRR
jgi:hypothetical protein